jgi:hypothetical protein
VHQIKEQLKLFAAKFLEFEATLTKSDAVMNHFEEKQGILSGMLDSLRADHSELKKRAELEDVSLIAAVEKGRVTEGEMVGLRAVQEKLEKKCRKLQAGRKELLIKLEEKKLYEHAAVAIGDAGGGSTLVDTVGESGDKIV